MRRAPALSFLLVTVFIDMLGLGLVVPILPTLMNGLTGDAGEAARWSGVIASGYGLLQFLTAPLLGRLSDRYGRRPVLLTSLAFLGVDWLGHALTSAVWPLMVVHALAGLFAGTNTVVNAYLADVTPPERRAHAYGLVGAAFGLGFVAGPTIGGLLGAVDVRLPFWVAAALCVANVTYGFFVLPESRPGDRVTALSLRAANPIGSLAAVLRRPVLGRLAAARFCSDIARNTHQAVWTFFVTYQFAWGTTRMGLTMAAGALAGAVVQARATGPAVRWLGDKRAAVLGGAVVAFSFVGIALATDAWVIYLMQAAGVLGGIGGSAAQSWISGRAGDDEQGTVNGALTSGGAIAEAAVPTLAGTAFAWSLAYAYPGMVFLGAAAFATAATILMASTSG